MIDSFDDDFNEDSDELEEIMRRKDISPHEEFSTSGCLTLMAFLSIAIIIVIIVVILNNSNSLI